jgi:redox-sensitive bicupin YhaK (pirin superfamily)
MSASSESAAVQAVIEPKAKDIGAFEVRRALPSAEARAVGPFIFFDQMGPAELGDRRAMDVRPHPHIGLATLTWMIDGVIMHRDSLGSAVEIKPGEVNLMTAGRGIVHSERTPNRLRGRTHRVFGVQCWLALPEADQETDPDFQHFDADDLPVHEADGVRAVLVMGSAWGLASPVKTFADAFCAEVTLEAGARLDVPSGIEERAVHVLDGDLALAGETHGAGRMAVLRPGADRQA